MATRTPITIAHGDGISVVGHVTALGLTIAVTFSLRLYDGKAGYRLAQGQ